MSKVRAWRAFWMLLVIACWTVGMGVFPRYPEVAAWLHGFLYLPFFIWLSYDCLLAGRVALRAKEVGL